MIKTPILNSLSERDPKTLPSCSFVVLKVIGGALYHYRAYEVTHLGEFKFYEDSWTRELVYHGERLAAHLDQLVTLTIFND